MEPKKEDKMKTTNLTAPAMPTSEGISTQNSETSNQSESMVTQRLRQYIISDSVDGDAEFNENLTKALEAMTAGIYPQLVPMGTSGTYFVYGRSKEILAVFKPRDEEPFALNNPKWSKFFQRILCSCCFGRSCLVPNNGYISETAASMVDGFLNLNVVPKTRIVKLGSPSFSYSRRCGCCSDNCSPDNIRPKEGSYQVYVSGYQSATAVINEWNTLGISNTLTPDEIGNFTLLFQKMCILDYSIRNTDRHLDNWLIRHVPGEELKIAAIDNGLAFPFKHPESASRFRQFPFDWAALTWAVKPWDKTLSSELLSILTPQHMHRMCSELKTLLRHGQNNRALVNNQLHVFRGQIWNLIESLRAEETPNDLVKRTPVLLIRKNGNSLPTNDNWQQWYRFKRVDYRNRNCC